MVWLACLPRLRGWHASVGDVATQTACWCASVGKVVDVLVWVAY